jgi:hypothetical protein
MQPISPLNGVIHHERIEESKSCIRVETSELISDFINTIIVKS